MITPTKWISVEGELSAEAFREQASKLQAKCGGTYKLRRYFCEDEELFRVNGRTYALSNQWSVNSIDAVDELMAMLPSGAVGYVKAIES